MPRTFVVKKDSDLRSLSSALLDARFRGPQADGAMERLKALNPHADLDKVPAGTVLFVPDSPGFKPSVGTSAQSGPIDEFRSLVSSALNDASARLRSGNAARASERSDVAAALKSAAFKRVAGDDKDVAQQASDAQKAMATEESEDKQAEETFEAASKAVLASLAQLGKLAG
jgi:hypothetical protein